MFEILDGFVSEARGLVIAGMTVLAIVFVGMTWVKTRALAPTLGAVLLGAVVVYAVGNFDDLAGDIERDVERQRVDVSDE